MQKYIVIQHLDKEIMFVFPHAIDHDEMMNAIKIIKMNDGPRDWHRPYFNAKPIAAGFIADRICFGYSETLGIGSRHDLDRKLLP